MRESPPSGGVMIVAGPLTETDQPAGMVKGLPAAVAAGVSSATGLSTGNSADAASHGKAIERQRTARYLSSLIFLPRMRPPTRDSRSIAEIAARNGRVERACRSGLWARRRPLDTGCGCAIAPRWMQALLGLPG